MEVFAHIKYVIGIILSFSVAHLLKGTVKFIQHPNRVKPYIIHLLLVFYVFLMLVHFWWFEFKLTGITEWHFFTYLFIILYITNYYIICSILFPDDINDYKDYKDYYFSRRKWIFGLLSLAFIADAFDAFIKGTDYVRSLGWEFPVRNFSHLVLCLLAIFVKKPKFHLVLVCILIVYEVIYISRLYDIETVIKH